MARTKQTVTVIRSLAGTRLEHERQLAPNLDFAKRHTAKAKKALEAGQCGIAAKSLLTAAAGWGEYSLHRAHAESNAAGESVASMEYGEVKDRFLRTCIVKR